MGKYGTKPSCKWRFIAGTLIPKWITEVAGNISLVGILQPWKLPDIYDRSSKKCDFP
jgi:hypothetical protein